MVTSTPSYWGIHDASMDILDVHQFEASKGWVDDQNVNLNELYETYGDQKMVMVFELNYLSLTINTEQLSILLAGAETHHTGVIVIEDASTTEWSTYIRDNLTNEPTLLDANKTRVSEIISNINTILETPGGRDPERY